MDDKRLVAWHYLTSHFPFDLIVTIMYMIPLIRQNQSLNFLQLIPAVLLWVKKFKYQREIEFMLQYRPGVRTSFTLIILTIDVLMIGNYGACIFIGMDILLYDN